MVGRWWSLRTAGLLVVGVGAGIGAWALGPRAALAVAMGVGVTGTLVVLTWLRARLRVLAAELAQVRAAHRASHQWEKRLRADLSAIEQRLLAAHGTTERRVRAEVSSAEMRLRSAASGDLVALEKRLRDVPPQRGTRQA